MVGTSQKWPAKAGGRSPKGPAVAGTTLVSLRVEIVAPSGDHYCIDLVVPSSDH